MPSESSYSNGGSGLTRGYVDCFLMNNGLPTYDPQANYSDETVQDVRKNRDNRLYLFLKEEGQHNIIKNLDVTIHGNRIEPIPPIIGTKSTAFVSSTGYVIRKGGNMDGIQYINGRSSIGSIVLRAAEAYLNYVEAYYERYGRLDEKSTKYWNDIRHRAKLPDYDVTVSKTDVSKEAKNDWGAYSAGKLIDPTLYSIRRERRCELFAEGFRYNDLMRWRAMDQMITKPYQVEGLKLWGTMKDLYTDEKGNSELKYGTADANVSSPDVSVYLRPYQVKSNNPAYNGYKWKMAHYLSPIATKHFQLTSPLGQYEQSIIYQNPGWSRQPNTAAEF